MGWLWLKGCQSLGGVPLPHPYSLCCPFLSWSPLPYTRQTWGWGRGKKEEGGQEGRAQAARAGEERGRSWRVGAGWLRRQDLNRRGPGMDSFPPLLPPNLQHSGSHLPPHTPRSYTHHLLPQPAPYFLLSLLSWAQKDVGVPALRVGGDRSEPSPQNSTKPGPAPSPSFS